MNSDPTCRTEALKPLDHRKDDLPEHPLHKSAACTLHLPQPFPELPRPASTASHQNATQTLLEFPLVKNGIDPVRFTQILRMGT